MIKRLNRASRRCTASTYIYWGGTAAVSEGIERQFVDKGCEVTRLGGKDRYETSVLIAREISDITNTIPWDVFFASGENFPDALAAGNVAGWKETCILYVAKSGKLSESARQFIKTTSPHTAYILGGENAVGKAIEDELDRLDYENIVRLGGQTRYDTAYEILNEFREMYSSGNLSFATGENYPDALAGGAHACKQQAPLVLVDNKTVHAKTQQFLASLDIQNVYVYGGANTVSDAIVHKYLDTSTLPSNTTAPSNASTKTKITTTTTTQMPGIWATEPEMEAVIQDVIAYCESIGVTYEPSLNETNSYSSALTQMGTGPYPTREKFTDSIRELIQFEVEQIGYEFVNIGYVERSYEGYVTYLVTVYFG